MCSNWFPSLSCVLACLSTILGRIPEAFSRSKHHALGLPSLQNCEQVKFSHSDFISSVKFCFSGRKQRQTPNIRWDVATHKLPITPYPSSSCRCLQLPWHGKRDGSQSPFGIEHFMPWVPVAVGYGTQASAEASLPSLWFQFSFRNITTSQDMLESFWIIFLAVTFTGRYWLWFLCASSFGNHRYFACF